MSPAIEKGDSEKGVRYDKGDNEKGVRYERVTMRKKVV